MNTRIKEIRKTLKLSQAKFAEAIKSSQESVARWESGGATIPEARVLQICQTFGVSRAWLETGSGGMFDAKENGAEVDERTAIRRFILETFERLPDDKQRIILDALDEYIEITKKKESKTQDKDEETVIPITPKIPRPGDRIAADPLL